MSTTKNADNTTITVGSAGEINWPLQPAFFATLVTGVSNVTGDGTVYSPVIFDTVIYDQASNYSTGTGTFTAPVLGDYEFTVGITLNTIGVSNSCLIQILMGGNNHNIIQVNPTVIAVGGVLTLTGSTVARLAAAATAVVRVTCSGTTKTVGVSGQATNPITWFSGRLIC